MSEYLSQHERLSLDVEADYCEAVERFVAVFGDMPGNTTDGRTVFVKHEEGEVELDGFTDLYLVIVEDSEDEAKVVTTSYSVNNFGVPTKSRREQLQPTPAQAAATDQLQARRADLERRGFVPEVAMAMIIGETSLYGSEAVSRLLEDSLSFASEREQELPVSDADFIEVTELLQALMPRQA